MCTNPTSKFEYFSIMIWSFENTQFFNTEKKKTKSSLKITYNYHVAKSLKLDLINIFSDYNLFLNNHNINYWTILKSI